MRQDSHGTLGRLVFATALLALGAARPAAAVDLSGVYVGQALGFSCLFAFVQTGTALEITGTCFSAAVAASGTVDPDTGAFSVTGTVSGFCPNVAATGTGDGEVFTATIAICAAGGSLSGTKCSNGVIDPGEDCEDGNARDGDCCSARCVSEPEGQTCTDRNDCTVGDVCTGGTCVSGPPASAGQACVSDGRDCTDDVCNATGACTHVPNTDPCDLGSYPTRCRLGVCSGGSCVPGPPAPAGQACEPDSTVCTDDICNGTGTCEHVPNPANTGPCNDFNGCTSGGHCEGGICQGSPNTDTCDDRNACTIDDVCLGGACRGSPAPAGQACDRDFDTYREKVCTNDICDGSGLCQHIPGPACFGPNDSGIKPSNRDAFKCEKRFATQVSKAAAGISKCWMAAAASKSFPECEDLVLSDLEAAIPTFSNPSCSCLGDGVSFNDLLVNFYGFCPFSVLTCRSGITSSDVSAKIYCDPAGIPFPDFSYGLRGTIPVSREELACENRIARCVPKLIKAHLKCHQQAAKYFLANGPFDEATCEQSAAEGFDTCTARVLAKGGCNGCEDIPGILQATTEGIEYRNGLIFCTP